MSRPPDLPGRTFEFARRAMFLCQSLDRRPVTSRVIATQLMRAATSVGANVEEGQASQSRADFAAKYSIACKEAREAHYWLRLLAVSTLVPRRRLDGLIDEADQLVAILTAIVKAVRSGGSSPPRV